jgi:L-amino acid N-acyltransferase YncA
MNQELLIRPIAEKDFETIYQIFSSIIKKGDSYLNRPSTTKEEIHKKWIDNNLPTFVAELNGKTVGAYSLRNNHIDLGSHVANASFIVDENVRGQGIGKTLGKHCIATAKNLGYKAIQFNFVVSTNKPAVNLWQSLGFKIIGTIPKAYQHQQLKELVDVYIMHREL